MVVSDPLLRFRWAWVVDSKAKNQEEVEVGHHDEAKGQGSDIREEEGIVLQGITECMGQEMRE